MKMKKIIALALLAVSSAASADTTINAVHHYAYSANAGWIDARADVANGAVVGQAYCVGYLWGANVGWIGLGNGPTNGWHYTNASATDWGVNHDGAGRLNGYAYGANIGWITFEQAYGLPRIDLQTGDFSGYAYSANIGWISLANNQAFVQTDTLAPGPDTDSDGIPDAWEYQASGNLTTLANEGADGDGDGVPDVDEYEADTNPLDDTDQFKIVSLDVLGVTNRVAWTSRPTRLYRLEGTNVLSASSPWPDVGGGLLGPPSTSITFHDATNMNATARFYRVRAVRPLSE